MRLYGHVTTADGYQRTAKIESDGSLWRLISPSKGWALITSDTEADTFTTSRKN